MAPIAPGDERYCEQIATYLRHCRARFGQYTLRCNRARATACSSHFFGVSADGRCGAFLLYQDVAYAMSLGCQAGHAVARYLYWFGAVGLRMPLRTGADMMHWLHRGIPACEEHRALGSIGLSAAG